MVQKVFPSGYYSLNYKEVGYSHILEPLQEARKQRGSGLPLELTGERNRGGVKKGMYNINSYFQQIPSWFALGGLSGNINSKVNQYSNIADQNAYQPAQTDLLGLLDNSLAVNPYAMSFDNTQNGMQTQNAFMPGMPQQDFFSSFMNMMMSFMQMFMQFMGMATGNNQLNQAGMQTMPGLEQTGNLFNNGGLANTAPYDNTGALQNPNFNPDPNAPAYTPQGSTEFGRQVAAAGERMASSMNSRGWCAKGVRQALESIGINGIGAASAYMIADQLARHDKFKEVTVTRDQLKSLPAGAIVVWDKTGNNPHGHISIALGDGREASDHVQSQATTYGDRFRVFLPVGQ